MNWEELIPLCALFAVSFTVTSYIVLSILKSGKEVDDSRAEMWDKFNSNK